MGSSWYLATLGTGGKLKVLGSASSSDLLTGVYDGIGGLFPQPDGSMLAVCLENTTPSYIRILRLQN